MDTAQWPQDIVVKPVEEIVTNTCSKPCLERKVRPQKDQAVSCPRCNSTNTKFCYYNNYSLSQPRYFCKTCRRYWTEGGSLRNIPVGGSSRKNKRSSSSKKISDLTIAQSQNPNLDETRDLNLGFSIPSASIINNKNNNNIPSNSSSSTSSANLSALELLTGRGLNSIFPFSINDPTTVYNYSLPELRPSLNFSLDGLGLSNYGSFQGMEETASTGKLLFPFEEVKSKTSTDDVNEQIKEHHQNGDSTGYWNELMGGGHGGSW